MSLTQQEIIRYSRHIILPEVGGRGQRKLKEASVLLIGAGALGGAAGLYLAAAGIGQITLWDSELVGPDDLAGGMGHDRARLGWPRARSLGEPVRAINPDATVEVLDRESDLLGAIPAHQVVIATVGDWAEIAVHAKKAGTALVLAGLAGAAGAATVLTTDGAGFESVSGERFRAVGLVPESSTAVSAAAGVIGVVAATEAIKLILGTGFPLEGRVLTYDGWRAHFDEIAIS